MPVTRTKSKWVAGSLRWFGHAPSVEAVEYADDGAIDANDGVVILTKGSAQAMTLADPTDVTDDGKRLCITSATAYAHTVSNAAGSGFNGGGSDADVATFGGNKGDTIELVAWNGDWHVSNARNVSLG